MASQRPAPPTVSCIYCGDEIVIPGAILPTGAYVCADCAEGELVTTAAPTTNPPAVPPRATEGQPRDRAADDKGKIGIESEARGRAAFLLTPDGPCDFTGCVRVKGHGSFHTTIEGVAKHQDEREASEKRLLAPRCFHPQDGAQELAIEVEEWIWLATCVTPLATPTDLCLPVVAMRLEDPTKYPLLHRFVVVLEWCRDGGPTRRDLGPSFGMGIDDRKGALVEATAFARAEAKRLKACGPYGYRPARAIPEI